MKMWSGPGRALQEHLRRFERTIGSPEDEARRPQEAEFWDGFSAAYGPVAEVLEGATRAQREDFRNSKLNHARGIAMRQIERDLLNTAITNYVSHHITTLVTGAAAYAEPEPLFPTDVPSPSGIAILEHPILIPDLHPETGEVREDLPLPIRAIGWILRDINRPDGTQVPGIIMVTWTDADSYEEVYLPAVAALTGEPVVPSKDSPKLPGLHVVDLNPWGFGTVWGETPDIHDSSAESRQVISSVAYMRRWLLSLFRLMWQEVILMEPSGSDRSHRRRCDRINWQRPDNDVSILKLRRVYVEHDFPQDDEHGWTLDHRIIVRGHWRQQFYPSLGEVGDPDAYRRIWIDAHIRGPESGPLIVKHNVTALVR